MLPVELHQLFVHLGLLLVLLSVARTRAKCLIVSSPLKVAAVLVSPRDVFPPLLPPSARKGQAIIAMVLVSKRDP